MWLCLRIVPLNPLDYHWSSFSLLKQPFGDPIFRDTHVNQEPILSRHGDMAGASAARGSERHWGALAAKPCGQHAPGSHHGLRLCRSSRPASTMWRFASWKQHEAFTFLTSSCFAQTCMWLCWHASIPFHSNPFHSIPIQSCMPSFFPLHVFDWIQVTMRACRAGIFLAAQQHLPLLRCLVSCIRGAFVFAESFSTSQTSSWFCLRRAMNVALPDATLKLKLLTNLSDEEKRSHSTMLAASRACASI